MVLAGFEWPIVTQIRVLLLPKLMRELRVNNKNGETKQIKAVKSVKIAAKGLDIGELEQEFKWQIVKIKPKV
ncbi:hypothetical protein QYM36_005146 [Artemia franciscana]|uniref:Uncharacterized protein n=1 Tax=Artemia franciscana TaxID=6661 RepID=A0AA88HWS6_ARTSF|nr:hypothetical protein QYM36_005146 [Artemia franciscana]